jgi:hypothetical protein
VDDPDPDHRELGPTRLLDDGEGHRTDLITATFGAKRCGRPIPGLTASATCDCDDVAPAFTAEIVLLATHRTYDVQGHRQVFGRQKGCRGPINAAIPLRPNTTGKA